MPLHIRADPAARTLAVDPGKLARPQRHHHRRPRPRRRRRRADRAAERRGVPAEPGRAVGAQPRAVPADRHVRVARRAAAAHRRRDAVRPRACRSPRTCSGSTSRASSAAGRSASCRARRKRVVRSRRSAGAARRGVGPARILGGADPGEPRRGDARDREGARPRPRRSATGCSCVPTTAADVLRERDRAS